MEKIIKELSTNKAVAFDSLSDAIFKNNTIKIQKEEGNLANYQLTAKKLRNLWRTNLDQLSGMDSSWDARLVALNKVFPETPTRKQMRPIVVQRSLVKLLEARFLNKVQSYLTNRLDRSQTGFVDKMGIQVNLWRALNRITERFKIGKPVFGLFIDFSNAYNYVPYTLLFKKLRTKSFFVEVIQFLECLYARYRIRME